MNFLIFLEDKLDDVLYENIENRIPKILPILLGKKSKWIGKKKYETEEEQTKKATELIYRLKEFDPTNTDKFAPFLAKQVANGSLPDEKVEEDGPTIRDALNIFLQRKKATWPGEKDIMNYTDYRKFVSDAFRHADEIEDVKQKSSKKKDAEKQALDEAVEKVVDVNGITIYKSSDPVAISRMGRAPVSDFHKDVRNVHSCQWCTSDIPYRSKSDKRSHYLSDVDWGDPDSVQNYKDLWLQEIDTFYGKVKPDEYIKKTKYLPWDSIDDVMSEIDAAAEGKTDMVPNLGYIRVLRQAENYAKNGPLYIMLDNGKLHMQMESNGNELSAPDNVSISKVSKRTASALIELLKREDTPEALANRIKTVLRDSMKRKT